jgi:hypothetical protein
MVSCNAFSPNKKAIEIIWGQRLAMQFLSSPPTPRKLISLPVLVIPSIPTNFRWTPVPPPWVWFPSAPPIIQGCT